jgi:hypothetical protein
MKEKKMVYLMQICGKSRKFIRRWFTKGKIFKKNFGTLHPFYSAFCAFAHRIVVKI